MLCLLLLLSLPVHAAPSKPIALFGLTLGQPWPTSIRSCENTVEEQRDGTTPCHNKTWRLHAPFQSGMVETNSIDGKIYSFNAELVDCEESVQAITKKLGPATDVSALERENGFGATWTYTKYLWKAANEDQVIVHMGLSNPNACSLDASSKKWRDDARNQTAKSTF
jgi:hypothetical protein